MCAYLHLTNETSKTNFERSTRNSKTRATEKAPENLSEFHTPEIAIFTNKRIERCDWLRFYVFAG